MQISHAFCLLSVWAIHPLDDVTDALRDSDPATAELQYWHAARKRVLHG